MAAESMLRRSFYDFGLLVGDGTIGALAGTPYPRQCCLANPRNTGIRAARAQWVAFQNSDNEWLQQKLEKQIALLIETELDVVVCNTSMTIIGQPEQGRDDRTVLAYISDLGERFVEGDLLARSFFSTQMFMARRSAVLETGGFDESLVALVDWDCVIWLAQRGHFVFADEPLRGQNFSDNSITLSRVKRLQTRIQIAIAGVQRRIGDLAAACASLAVARRLHPQSLPIWLRTLWLIALFLLFQKRPAKGS